MKRWLATSGRLLLALCMICGVVSAQEEKDAKKKARRWRVMVIVQETHLARPRIPDPAVETMLSKQLIEAGYKVIDQDRIANIRYHDVLDRILKGGKDSLKEAVQLGRRFGADVLITGEAFTQEVTRETIETDIGNVLRIRCRARVELKGIRMDTAEKFYANSIQKTGPPEATVELSSKACLEDAAEAMSDALVEKLDGLSQGKTQQVDLQVRGMKSAAQSQELEAALAKVAGVLEVASGEFDSGVYDTELTVDKKQLSALSGLLETSPLLKKFKLKVQSANKSRIVVNCK